MPVMNERVTFRDHRLWSIMAICLWSIIDNLSMDHCLLLINRSKRKKTTEDAAVAISTVVPLSGIKGIPGGTAPRLPDWNKSQVTMRRDLPW